MMAIVLTATEGSIVATAMPTIVADLGGFHLFSWAFAAFLLTQAVSIPIYGRLADLYGRKPVFFAGTSLFLVASLLCGLASGMAPFIIFRALQGAGAGAIQPIATTIVGDIYTPAERARVQGYLSGVFGIAALFGPPLGAFLVEHVSWSFVFWINLPIGAASFVMLSLFLPERRQVRPHQTDYAGSALLTLGAGALMLVLIEAQSLGRSDDYRPHGGWRARTDRSRRQRETVVGADFPGRSMAEPGDRARQSRGVHHRGIDNGGRRLSAHLCSGRDGGQRSRRGARARRQLDQLGPREFCSGTLDGPHVVPPRRGHRRPIAGRRQLVAGGIGARERARLGCDWLLRDRDRDGLLQYRLRGSDPGQCGLDGARCGDFLLYVHAHRRPIGRGRRVRCSSQFRLFPVCTRSWRSGQPAVRSGVAPQPGVGRARPSQPSDRILDPPRLHHCRSGCGSDARSGLCVAGGAQSGAAAL